MKYTTPWCMHMALIIQFLLASMLVLPGAESSEYYRRPELIDVDANGSFTRGELVRPAAERAHLRAAMLSPADTQDKKLMVELTTYKSEEGHFAYLMPLEVYDMNGNPQSIRAVADTGSDMVWMKMEFSTKQLKELPCSCTSRGGMLYAFIKTYGMAGIKAVKGFVCTDQKLSLILSPSKTKSQIKKIRLGFAIHYDRLLPSSAHGIVGLGRNEDFSLVNQLGVTKFSYCLSSSTDKNSPFWFGDDSISVPDLKSLKSTPLVKVPLHTDRYYVELLGISIGDGKMKELPMHYFKLKGQDGNRVMFIDSGMSRTILEPCVFEELEKQLDQHRKKLGNSNKPITKDDKVHTCFPPDTADHEKVDLVLHFKGAQMSIPWDNYMRQEKPESSDFCLAIKGTAAHGESILGNNLQHNIYMRYDIDPAGEKLSFKKADCSKSISKGIPSLLP